jgi:hypothetical protein
MYTNINQENVHLPSFGGRESDNMGLVPYIYFDPEYSVLDEIKSSILIAETTMYSHFSGGKFCYIATFPPVKNWGEKWLCSMI